MLKVSGCLSSLFRMVDNTVISNWEEISDTMINQPITDGNGKCIGIITEVDRVNDTWSCYLMKDGTVEMTMDLQKCVSVVIK